MAGLAVLPARGADRDQVLGTWKLVSYDVEVKSSGKRIPVMGEHPTGYAALLPDGRIFFVLTGTGRKPAKTDHERAELLSTLVAYTGTYTVTGNQWTTEVDAAWDPNWVGAKEVRNFTLKGDTMQVVTPWRLMPNWASQGETRSCITFQKEP
ncbi:MAG: lipocalin-like domain-containing protein [Verrucomicrobiota bacterium]